MSDDSVTLEQGAFSAEKLPDGSWLLHVSNVSSADNPVIGTPISTGSTASLANSIMIGKTDAGKYVNVPVTAEGHIEVAIHSPILPFRSVHTENLTPVFQSDGVYGINTFSMITTTGLVAGTGTYSGFATGTNNMLVVGTGNTPLSFASLQSRRRLRYRPGQGVVGRFAGLFSTPANASIMVAGFGTAETTLAFGYSGTMFGILYSTGGVREVHTLTINTASTSTQPYRITMPNGENVFVTGTNNSSTTQTAYEISLGTFSGYRAAAIGSTVSFLANSSGNKTGSFVLAQPGAVTPAAGTDTETTQGVANTDTWIPQSQWNGDVLDGSGSDDNPSGIQLDPQKGNVYQIGVQYLGFGSITFDVELISTTGNNNPEFVTVHTIKYPNANTVPSLRQPAFPFLISAYSLGSSTNVQVSIGSFGGFNEGQIVNTGPRSSYSLDTTVTTSTTLFKPLFTVRNGGVFRNKANQTVVHLLDVSGDTQGNANSRTKFYLIRDAVLSGPVNFQAFSANSSAYWDIAATGMNSPSNDQVIWTRTLGQTADFEYAFSDREITLQPGESITLAVKSLGATATSTGAVNTREDQ